MSSLQYAKIDQDMLQIQRLLEIGAFKAAEDIYVYGKHVRIPAIVGEELISLSTLVNFQSVKSPEARMFRNHFQSSYESTTPTLDLIDSMFDTSNHELDGVDRKTIINRSLLAEKLHFGVLEDLHRAVSSCYSESSADAITVESWDRAAALIVGSLEKDDLTGGHSGFSHVALADESCQHFGVCAPEGGAVLNYEIQSVLREGENAAVNGSCEDLENLASVLRSLLIVPFVQQVLISSMELSSSSLKKSSLANGYVFSRTLIPLLESVDSFAAETLESSFQLNLTTVDRDSARKVFVALAQVYEEVAIDCHLIGVYKGTTDACNPSFSRFSQDEKARYLMILLWTSVGSLVLITVIFIFKTKVFNDQGRSPRQLQTDLSNAVVKNPGVRGFFAPRDYIPRSSESERFIKRSPSDLTLPSATAEKDIESRPMLQMFGWTTRQDTSCSQSQSEESTIKISNYLRDRG
jgi:hypothetical protein